MAKIKPLLMMIGVVLGGAGAGTGSAFAVANYMGLEGHARAAEAEDEDVETTFVAVEEVMIPLTYKDGRLAGYANISLSLEVPVDDEEEITARVPLIRHAINMRAFRKPMAAGRDGLLPDLESFRGIVETSAKDVFGPKKVRKVAITSALPA